MIKDLTQGSPDKVLLQFSVPMFISAIFQQLYNIADSVIAGKFAGEDALAAIGASYPITMVFMAIAFGINIGCSVIISQLFGAKQMEKVKTAIFTTLISTLALSCILTGVGMACSHVFMDMVDTPQNIYSGAMEYFNIFILGLIFLFFYNVCNGIFTSMGDSKTPLYLLIVSSVANVFLDLLFVAVYHWGIAGAAWATFMAQGASGIMAVIILLYRVKRLASKEFAVFSFDMLKQIGVVSIPSILQQSSISIGNILVQRVVNGFGSSVIAGYASAIKLNTFALMAINTLSNAVSCFTAQNIGAKKFDRVKLGFKSTVKMTSVIIIPFTLIYFIFSTAMIQIFLPEDSTQAIPTGVLFLKIVSPFYLVVALKIIADGILRGCGLMKQFMISTFVDLVLRAILAFVFAAWLGSTGIWLSWPIGWSVGMVLSVYYYKKIDYNSFKSL